MALRTPKRGLTFLLFFFQFFIYTFSHNLYLSNSISNFGLQVKYSHLAYFNLFMVKQEDQAPNVLAK